MADIMPDTTAPMLTGATTRLRLADIYNATTPATAYVEVDLKDANSAMWNSSPTVTKYEAYAGAQGKIGGTRKVVTGEDCNIDLKTAGRLTDPAIALLVANQLGGRLGFEYIEPNGIIRRGTVVVPPYKPQTPVRGIYEMQFTLEVDGEYDFIIPA